MPDSFDLISIHTKGIVDGSQVTVGHINTDGSADPIIIAYDSCGNKGMDFVVCTTREIFFDEVKVIRRVRSLFR